MEMPNKIYIFIRIHGTLIFIFDKNVYALLLRALIR
jgi:hypothetical protein